jgi:opacity protein-like surface antigen
MKKLFLGVFIALAIASAAFATSTDELMLCINGASCITVLDTTNSNSITYANANFHGWNLQVIFGTSGSNANVQPALELTSLTATCVSTKGLGCGTNTLDVLYSDINFNVPTTPGQWSNQYSTTITAAAGRAGSTSELAWVDTANTIFGTPAGGAIPTVGPFTGTNSGTTLGGPGTTTSPYSVTVEQIFSDNSSCTTTKAPFCTGSGLTFSSDGSVSGSPVPEPTAIILFGTVVALCTSRLRRRRAS